VLSSLLCPSLFAAGAPEGASWLAGVQAPDGSWSRRLDIPGTSWATLALEKAGMDVSADKQALLKQDVTRVSDLALIYLATRNNDIGAKLAALQQADGSWGDVATTALVVAGGGANGVARAVDYLLQQQDADLGGWGLSGEPSGDITGLVLWALLKSGIAADDPRIASSISYFNQGDILRSKDGGTIGLAYVLLAMQSLGNLEDQATRIALFLKGSRISGGGWSLLPDTSYNTYATGVVAYALGGQNADDNDLKRGLDYLKRTRDPNGGWYKDALALRDTPVTANALGRTALEQAAQSKAIQWLSAHGTDNIDQLARKIEALSLVGMDATALLGALSQKQNPDGGFGVSSQYGSDNLDTFLAVRAFAVGNRTNDPALGDKAASAVSFLLASQNGDGSWGLAPGSEGTLAMTAQVMAALADSLGKISVNPDFVNNAVKKASLWLSQKQNQDGGFGAPESNVVESALGYSALIRGVQPATLSAALDFIKGKQGTEGSWNLNPYDTSLALFALQDQAQPPVALADLAVFPADVAFQPSNPGPNQQFTISVAVHNVGGTDASGVILRVYNGDPGQGGTLLGEEQRIALIRSGETVIARFNTAIPVAGIYDIFALVDPDNAIPEANEANNRATTQLTVVTQSGKPDLVILPSDLSYQPSSPRAGDPIQISAVVHSASSADANGVVVRFYIGDPTAGGKPLGPDFLFPTIPAGGRAIAQLAAALPEGQHSIFAVADPDNKINELAENNNLAAILITVVASPVTLADLELPAADISFSNDSPKAGEAFNINATLHNRGGTDAKNFAVKFYDGDPGAGGKQLGPDFDIPNLPANSSASLQLQAVSLTEGGHTIFIVADPYGQVPESDETDNIGSKAITVAPNPKAPADLRIPSLSVDPSPPVEKQQANVKAVVRNDGQSEATAVLLQVYDGNPDQGASLIGEFTIPALPGDGSEANVTIPWTPQTLGGHTLWARVDPFNTVPESNEANNNATLTVNVQKAPPPPPDLVVTDRDIILSNPAPRTGEKITITANVSNAGGADVNGAMVRFFDGDPAQGGMQIGADVTGNVQGGRSTPFTVEWDTTGREGDHEIFVLVDPDNKIAETDETNNFASVRMHVGNLPPSLSWTGEFGFTGGGVYPPSGNPTTLFEYRVKYTDPNNDPPAQDFPKVWIDINGDGEYKDTIDGFVEGAYVMQQADSGDANYADGKIYVFKTTLPRGRSATYKFEAQDSSGLTAATEPAVVGVNAGPQVLDKPMVNVMPTYPAWPGKGEIIVWGNVKWAGVRSGTYRWDFGDGTPPVEGIVKDNPNESVGERSPRYIWLRHEFPTLRTYTATLTVTDDSGASDSDQVQIVVQPVSTDVRAKAAIEDGLRWLYLRQEADGRWSYSTYAGSPAQTAFAVLSFENNGHFASSNLERDIYADTVRNGINYLLNTKQQRDLSGDKRIYDQNGNGIGYYWSYHQYIYETGMVLMALSANTEERSPTYAALIQDVVDFLIWAQYHEGGWRYGEHTYGPDNSVSQWAVLGIESATGCAFNAKVPSWVLDANNPEDPFGFGLRHWLELCQVKRNDGTFDDGGGFGYGTGGAYGQMTASGLIQLFLAGYPGNSDRVQAALNWMNNNWTVDNIWGWGFYYQYALGKALRFYGVDRVGSHVWYDEMVDYLLSDTDRDRRVRDRRWYDNSPTSNVYSAGHWSAGLGEMFDTCWAVLTLTKAEVGARPVADAGPDRVVSPGQEVFFDGFASYHPDPKRKIIKYEWDFDNDGLFDAEGVNVSHIYEQEGIYTVTLKVTDDGAGCALTGRDTARVTVTGEAVHPPVADPGGPYQGFAGYDVTLDGSRSYDLDEAAGDKIVSYEWDLDGDGEFDDATGATVPFRRDTPYTGSIGLKVTDTTGLSDVKRTTITIVELKLASGVATDKQAYTAHELVKIESTVISQATGATYTDLMLAIRIYDPNDQEVFRDNRMIPALAPDQILKTPFFWNTGSNPPGDYKVVQQVVSQENILSQPQTIFKILPTPPAGQRGLAGTIQVIPVRVPQKQNARIEYSVTNTGNSDIRDITLEITVYEPPSGLLQRGLNRQANAIRTWTDTALAGKVFRQGERYTGSVVYENVDLAPDFYMVQLQGIIGLQEGGTGRQGGQRVPLASTNLQVVDPVPPVIKNTLPPDGTLTNNNKPLISGVVEDEAGGSGIDPTAIALAIDGVKVLHTYTPDPNPADANRKGTVTYTSAQGLPEGNHVITLDVRDKSGNPATQARWQITVDTIPPAADPASFTPPDGSDQQNDKPLVAVTISDGAGSGVDPATIVMKINGQVISHTYDSATGLVSYQPAESLDGGTNKVEVQMSDRATNQSLVYSWTFTVPITVKAEVLPALRPTPTALVWAEKKENADLAREVLGALNIPFRVVSTDVDYIRELRSGNYNLFLMLDVSRPVHEHFYEELTEHVYQGGGLVLSRFADLSGLRAVGLSDLRVVQYLYAGTYPVEIKQHPEIEIGENNGQKLTWPSLMLSANGQVQKIAPETQAQVVGYVNGSDPAAFLSRLGQGKVAYFSFDLASATPHTGAVELLTNALRYATYQLPEMAAHAFSGGQAIPVDLTVRNLGKAIQANLEVVIPTEVGIVDKTDGAVSGNNLTWNFPLPKGETKLVRFSLKAPEAIGTFTVAAKLSWLDGQAYKLLATRDLVLGVVADRPKLGGDIRAKLALLIADPAFSGADAARLKAADEIVALLLTRNPASKLEIQNDLWEVLRAVDHFKLLRVQNAKTLEVRLLLDRLVQLYEARWLAAKS